MQQNLQQRLRALNQAIIQLMGVCSIDRLCQEAITLGIGTLGFDRLGLYFTRPLIPGEPPMIAATYGTDEQGNVHSEQGIVRPLLENDWLITPAFLEAHHCAVRTQVVLVQPSSNSELQIVGEGWNAAAGLWDGEQIIGYLFADNLLQRRPYTEDDGELLAAYGLALGHLCTRLRVEEALRQRQSDHRALLEAMPDLFFALNKEGILLDYHCPAGVHLFSEAEQIRGQHIQTLVPAALAQQLLAAVEQTSTTGECVTIEYSVPVNHELQHYETRVIEARDGVILALVRNVTDRKFLEEQLIAAHKMESLGRMAGGIAHDFNNLLTVIQGYTSLAERQIKPDQLQLGKALTYIATAGEKGARLTNHLLSFARKQIVEPQILDLNLMLSEMQGVLHPILKETIELQIEAAAQPMPVRIAYSQFEQLLINLATNADDAMPDGGHLHIKLRRLALSAGDARRYLDARAGEYVLMEVSDSGTGIDQAIIRNIFDPFFTTKQAAKHSGLGLAICHGIAQQNGGHIAVQSTPQVATTVQIFLPYVQAQLSATSPMTATGNGEGQESILLVEDNPEVREITTKLLTEFGYTLRPFATGPEAVAYARQHPSTFDLLITDIMMPQMNGHAVANAILAIRPTLPILLISGYAEEQPDALVHRTHVGFLAKPYSATALTSKVRALLHQR